MRHEQEKHESAERVRDLLIELGEHWDSVDGVQENAEGGWAVLVHEDRRFDVDLDPDRAVLVLRTDVGHPHPARLSECCQALLSYNLLWPQTGGARTALGGTNGDASLLMDVPVDRMSWDRLEAVLRNMDDVARAWREYLQQPPQADGASAPHFPLPGQFA